MTSNRVTPSPAASHPWQNTSLSLDERVDALLAQMTLAEKVSQLVGLWVGAGDDGQEVAPYQHDMSQQPPVWDEVIKDGLGHLTRPFGTRPVDPTVGAKSLAAAQRQIMAANRFGIPAIAHEECLTGFAAHGATIYPTPLAWGASFDPQLIHEMARRIGTDMRAVGTHLGLSPVLDVTRDYRWGRTEETIGEDPYLVGTVATAYVRGLQAGGVHATLKHFAGYSASRAGRNLAPVSMGPQELADVILPPFEMAVVEGGVRSVMASYNEIDGVPVTADHAMLTTLLRDTWGFDGTIVSDYFAVAFLQSLHRVAATEGEAGALALRAGIDVELPNLHCYAEPLLAELAAGRLDIEHIDQAVRRVLRQKGELGLLDPDCAAGEFDADTPVVLDSPENRAVARRLAEESIVLVANNGTLPLAAGTAVALIGPRGADPHAMLGCYTFPAHVGPKYPEHGDGVEIPTLAEALAARLGADRVTAVEGCTVDGDGTDGFAAAVAAASRADVAVLAVGDRAGLFGRGTSGEGCDAVDLTLPGRQADLVEAVLDTGTPVVLVLLTGRPYALGRFADRAAAVVQAFFPGQQGGPALADILTGAVNPSGRLPVSLPRTAGGQPGTYLRQPLAGPTKVSNIDPTPLFPFGHGLAYTTFTWSDATVLGAAGGELPTDGSVTVRVTVHNTGQRDGTEVVQLYLGDLAARVTRPVTQLIGYQRVDVPAGQSRTVELDVHADLTSFADRDGRRVVEPGAIELRLAASSTDVRAVLPLTLTGELRHVDHTRTLRCHSRVLDRSA
ncbi:beta-xylosidase/alpha-l-arabinosidase [Goodfellowiella coeruleoviolacea]|uniref:Beta-xylosidase n=1 Tax=Goodfellowiella coeruleoviolacea TaxID=334858 RepID=A0AAE3G9J7_9PSEU|nr:glycoside hydrolase family 3 N-terminal domain-containing protein [Goodfellowiella coeruleoviolacea]MCP2163389.1 beta-xylosidase [Goodfellowiella coeruleoviolacea]